MDELQLVREYFGEQLPPEPGVAAAAKARLPLCKRGSRAAWPLRPPLAGWWRPSRRALLLPATVAAAAATVALVAVVAVVQVPSPVPVSGSSGRQILLTAARTVAGAAQPVTGRYWVTAGRVGNFLKVGPADDPYLMLEEVGVQYWAARLPRGGSPYLYQPLWVRRLRPATRRHGAATARQPNGRTSARMVAWPIPMGTPVTAGWYRSAPPPVSRPASLPPTVPRRSR